MSSAEIIDSIKIDFRDGNLQEMRMATFLRSRKDMGKQLKTEILKPLYSFLDTFAVGADPNSTPAEIETAFITSMIEMSSQMSALALYCRVEHGINLSPESWRTFGLLPSPIAQGRTSFDVRQNLPPTLENDGETTGQRLMRENREILPYIDQETREQLLSQKDQASVQETQSPRPPAAPEVLMETVIAPVPTPVPEVEEQEDDDYDPDYDPEDDLSDEEYSALVLGRIPNRQEVVHYD